jgi:plastocyanin
VLVSGTGCSSPEPDHPPDQLLQDSLGLTEDDAVFRVGLSVREARERLRPAIVWIPSGAWVEFVVEDRRVHTVVFELDSMVTASAAVLRRAGQDASPPLVELGARFLVEFRDAPPGRYPFRVEGSGALARGAVVVEAPGG